VHFESVHSFIMGARKAGGKVLVHCAAGISRSATMATAHLMAADKVTFDRALEKVSKARPLVCPNSSFRLQLMLWHGMNHSLKGESDAHKQYRLLQFHWAHARPYFAKPPPPPPPATDPAFDTVPNGVAVYKCSGCSRRLFHANHVVRHFGFVDGPNQCVEENYFVEPLAWVQVAENTEEQQLNCPDCGVIIGSKEMRRKFRCTCGVVWSPSLRIKKTKVLAFTNPQL